MLDEEQEKRFADDFMEPQCVQVMDARRFISIVIEGVDYCEDAHCLSKSISGECACRCIRSLFPSFAHYDAYLKLREIYLKNFTLTKFKGIK